MALERVERIGETRNVTKFWFGSLMGELHSEDLEIYV